MYFQPFSLKRVLLFVSAAFGLMLSFPSTPVAEAAFSGCRADPLFILSDGTILDVSVDIKTDVSNVEVIQYEVHGPRGVKLVASLSTPTLGFEGIEIVAYYDDAPPNQYTTDTLVKTSTQNVGVTAYTLFAGHNLLKLALNAQ